MYGSIDLERPFTKFGLLYLTNRTEIRSVRGRPAALVDRKNADACLIYSKQTKPRTWAGLSVGRVVISDWQRVPAAVLAARLEWPSKLAGSSSR